MYYGALTWRSVFYLARSCPANKNSKRSLKNVQLSLQLLSVVLQHLVCEKDRNPQLV